MPGPAETYLDGTAVLQLSLEATADGSLCPVLSASEIISDLCQMIADETLWLGRYVAAGGMTTPLQQVVGYTTRHIGALGTRDVRKLVEVTVETPPAFAACRGVLSLHPAGYALVESETGTVQMWRYASSTWTVAAEADPEHGLVSSGSGPDGTAVYPQDVVLPVSPGTYRLEVIDGEVYALPTYSGRFVVGQAGFVLRGAALQPINWADPLLPPVLVEYHATLQPWSEGYLGNRPQTVRWQDHWLYQSYGGRDALLSADDPSCQLALSGFYDWSPMLLTDGLRVLAFGPALSSYHGWDVQRVGGQPGYPTGQVAGQVASYDGQYLIAQPLDLCPVAGRVTGQQVWMLGVDAANLWNDPRYMDEPLLADWLQRPKDIYTMSALELSIASLTIEAEIRPAVSVASLQMEGLLGATTGATPSMSSLSVSCGGNSATTSPSLASVGVDATTRPAVALSGLQVTGSIRQPNAGLDGLTVEGLLGATSGDTPALGSLTVTCGGDADTTTPSLDQLLVTGLGLPFVLADSPSLGSFDVEALASGTIVPPDPEIEGVCWLSQTDATRLATEVRHVAGVPLADEASCRVVVGVVEPGDPVDWTQYQEVPWGSNVLLPEAAETVWVGVIGLLADDVPPVVVQVRRSEAL